MVALAEAASHLTELQGLAQNLLKPCGFACRCTRLGHMERTIATKTDPTHEATTREVLASTNLALTHLQHYASIPAFRGFVERALRETRQLSLLVEYELLKQWVIGDFPQFVEDQGTPRQSGRFTGNAGTFVYIAYDVADTVIYVGVTDDLFGRMAAHRGSGRWWPHMERLEWEEWPTRQAALRKESTLIRRYRPRFNVIGNPDAVRRNAPKEV